MSVLAKKLLGIGVGVVVVGVLIGLYVASWATSFPKTVTAMSTREVAGVSSTQLTLQTVAAIGPKYSPEHPDWVSYLVGQRQMGALHRFQGAGELRRARDGIAVRR